MKIVSTSQFIFCVERDPNSSLPPPLIGGYRPTVFGEEPPENEGYDELCPKRECPDCKRMHALRCEGSAKMYGLTILPYDTNFPGLPNRTGSKFIKWPKLVVPPLHIPLIQSVCLSVCHLILL